MKRQWRIAGSGYIYYYFQVHNGKVIGQVYNYANTVIWGAKIPVSATEEEILGQYIEMEYAKKAIEEYWDGKDRTINYTTNGLITHHEE